MMSNPNQEIDHLFRRSYGKMIAILTNKFGATYLQEVEDAVQEALIKAMQLWSFQPIPDNPEAWLMRVAKNRLLDVLRRQNHWTDIKQHWQTPDNVMPDDPNLSNSVADDQLRMIFACCHPSLSQEYQIILTLKLVAGFGNKEIAACLLKKEDTIAKAFTRAKKKLRSNKIKLKIPIELGLRSRQSIVVKIIYLIFTEGYKTHRGADMIRRDLCYEAVRLAQLLDQNKYCSQPNIKALLALMCFHVARFDARLDHNGSLIDLEHQDRSLWSQELIDIGISYLNQAYRQSDTPFDYLMQAYISYYHCTAVSFEATNWQGILDLYNLQLQKMYSPMVALNRIIPYQRVHGAEKAMAELTEYARQNKAIKNGLYYAILGDLQKTMGQFKNANASYDKAIALVENVGEKLHFKNKKIICPEID